MSSRRYRFGEFEFRPDSGELWRAGADEGIAGRLGPQPARLLELLLQKQGSLVAHEEIRKRLWPDVSVDFDANLHFCIRQIRAALNDSASAPSYIETLPRRGYRLMTPLESPAPQESEPDAPEAPASAHGRNRLWAAALALLVLTVAIWTLAGRSPTPPSAGGPRVAIMPFRSGDGIAEAILEDLVTRAGGRLQLIGPTTTAQYVERGTSLASLGVELELDYIVNGRFVTDENGPSMLAELIRLPDGAHVWVRRYRDLDREKSIGLEIGEHVARELGLSEPTREP